MILGGVFLVEGIAWLSIVALLGDRLNAALITWPPRASTRAELWRLPDLDT
jgi:hypothetical protein